MQRPEIPGLEVVDAVVAEIAETERKLTELKERLKSLPREIAESCESQQQRDEAAVWLYWFVPECPASAIVRMLGTSVGSRTWRRVMGRATYGVKCSQCNADLAYSSRKRLTTRAGICPTCEQRNRETAWAEIQRREQEQAARREHLRTMRYADYLRTPEWQARRAEQLALAGYKCQVCNARNVTLDVHHRTYARRGSEWPSDLFVLCRNCHDVFHQAGRLAYEETE